MKVLLGYEADPEAWPIEDGRKGAQVKGPLLRNRKVKGSLQALRKTSSQEQNSILRIAVATVLAPPFPKN